MKTINIHQAKTHLSRLVDLAEKGEPFIIAKAGRPMVRVTAIDAEPPKAPRRRGFLAGQITVPDDFDTMMQDEIIALFEGES
jgi:prevent-host-death family protein